MGGGREDVLCLRVQSEDREASLWLKEKSIGLSSPYNELQRPSL